VIAFLKWLLARWALFKLLLKSFGALAWLLPIALLLKALGWPVLLVLTLLAIPLLIVLAVIGLPLLLIAAAAGIMLAIAFWVITTGILLIKLAVPILLLVWMIRMFRRWNRGRGNGGSTAKREGGGPDAGGGVGAKVPEPPSSGVGANDMPGSGFTAG
jgi:uncharacterized membrane protein YgcG